MCVLLPPTASTGEKHSTIFNQICSIVFDILYIGVVTAADVYLLHKFCETSLMALDLIDDQLIRS